MRLGPQAVGLVERAQQFLAETPAYPASWQAPYVAKRPASQLGQGQVVGPDGRQRAHRQCVQYLWQWAMHPIEHPGAHARQRCQAVGRPGERGHAQFAAFTRDALVQFPAPAEQACAGLYLQDDGFIGNGNAGGELQGPVRQSVKVIIGRRCLVGAERQ